MAYAQTKYSSVLATVTISYFLLNSDETIAVFESRSLSVKYLVSFSPLAQTTTFNLSGLFNDFRFILASIENFQ